MVKPHLDRLFRHRGWANQRTALSLQECPAAQPLATPLLAHILAAEHIWLRRLLGGAPMLEVWPPLTFAECLTRAEKCDAGWSSFFHERTEEELLKEVEYRNSRGESFRDSVMDILMHVVAHGAHHRGQIARIVNQSGGKAAATDFILFARGK